MKVFRPNTLSDALGVSTGLLPTFVDILKACGCAVSKRLWFEGWSLLPVLQSEQVTWWDAAFLPHDIHHSVITHTHADGAEAGLGVGLAP